MPIRISLSTEGIVMIKTSRCCKTCAMVTTYVTVHVFLRFPPQLPAEGLPQLCIPCEVQQLPVSGCADCDIFAYCPKCASGCGLGSAFGTLLDSFLESQEPFNCPTDSGISVHHMRHALKQHEAPWKIQPGLAPRIWAKGEEST